MSAIDHRRISLSALMLLLTLLIAFPPAYAQIGAESGTTAEEPPPGPQPIPTSRITVEADQVRERVRELQPSAETTAPMEELERYLPAEVQRIRESRSAAVERLTGSLTLRQLQDMESRWQRERDLIREFGSQLERRASRVDAVLQEMQERRRLWELTQIRARDEESQEAVQSLIADVLSDIRSLENQLGERRGQLLKLQNIVLEMDRINDEVLEQIEIAQRERQVELVEPDRVPLWAEIADGSQLENLGDRVGDNLGHLFVDVKDFYAQNRSRIVLQGALFLALVATFVAIRRRLRKVEISEDVLGRFRRILEAPIGAALTISLALALLAYPKAPPAVIDVIAILIFFPFLTILAETINRTARIRFVLIWLLFILDRSALLFDYESAAPRLLLLLESALGLALLLRMKSRGVEILRGRSDVLRRIGHAMLLLFIAQLSVALLANIVGYVALANLLTSSVIISLYIGAILFGVFPAFRALVELGPELGIFQRLRLIQRHRALLERRSVATLLWVFFLVWFYSYLELLNVLPSVRTLFEVVLGASARFGELEISLGDIIAFAATIWIATLISRFVRFVFEEDVYDRLSLPRGVPHAISTSLHYVVLLIGFILAVAATGVDLSRVTLLLGAFGVGIGFGLQNVVNNFVSGIILIAERPVMPGDVIQLDTLYGEVKRIGMRASTVRTWEGAEVIVPNGELISRQVTNWTLSDRMRRVDVEVGVAYGTELEQVLKILQSVAHDHVDVASYPRPMALCTGFGDSAVMFSLRAWTHFDEFLRVRSELTVATEHALREAGITIPFPQRDLHVRSIDVEAARGLRRDGG